MKPNEPTEPDVNGHCSESDSTLTIKPQHISMVTIKRSRAHVYYDLWPTAPNISPAITRSCMS